MKASGRWVLGLLRSLINKSISTFFFNDLPSYPISSRSHEQLEFEWFPEEVLSPRRDFSLPVKPRPNLCRNRLSRSPRDEGEPVRIGFTQKKKTKRDLDLIPLMEKSSLPIHELCMPFHAKKEFFHPLFPYPVPGCPGLFKNEVLEISENHFDCIIEKNRGTIRAFDMRHIACPLSDVEI